MLFIICSKFPIIFTFVPCAVWIIVAVLCCCVQMMSHCASSYSLWFFVSRMSSLRTKVASYFQINRFATDRNHFCPHPWGCSSRRSKCLGRAASLSPVVCCLCCRLTNSCHSQFALCVRGINCLDVAAYATTPLQATAR